MPLTYMKVEQIDLRKEGVYMFFKETKVSFSDLEKYSMKP